MKRVGFPLQLSVFTVAVIVTELQGGEMSQNERGVYYRLPSDTGASIAIIDSMLVLGYTGLTIANLLTTVRIAGLVSWSAI